MEETADLDHREFRRRSRVSWFLLRILHLLAPVSKHYPDPVLAQVRLRKLSRGTLKKLEVVVLGIHDCHEVFVFAHGVRVAMVNERIPLIIIIVILYIIHKVHPLLPTFLVILEVWSICPNWRILLSR